MVNGFHLMAIKPVETEMFHRLNDITMKAKSGTIDRRLWREIPVVYECFAKFRVGFDGLNVIRKLHFTIALTLYNCLYLFAKDPSRRGHFASVLSDFYPYVRLWGYLGCDFNCLKTLNIESRQRRETAES
jgi:hypothetical protein